ncbi:MAG TPA: hypothetical protein DCR24_06150 [Bacillus bacterium]|nr:hypothetical protein [Bacillus sp. (in: firmicutes)]
MTIENLIAAFINSKLQVPKHSNVLLDFIRKEYVLGHMTIQQYYRLLKELNKRGAFHP